MHACTRAHTHTYIHTHHTSYIHTHTQSKCIGGCDCFKKLCAYVLCALYVQVALADLRTTPHGPNSLYETKRQLQHLEGRVSTLRAVAIKQILEGEAGEEQEAAEGLQGAGGGGQDGNQGVGGRSSGEGGSAGTGAEQQQKDSAAEGGGGDTGTAAGRGKEEGEGVQGGGSFGKAFRKVRHVL